MFYHMNSKWARAAGTLALVGLVMLCGTHDAAAQATSTTGTNVLSQATTILQWLYSGLMSTVYVIAGIAIIIMAIMSFFGRFQMQRFIGICFGVFLIASINSFMSLLTGGAATAVSTTSTSSASSNYNQMMTSL